MNRLSTVLFPTDCTVYLVPVHSYQNRYALPGTIYHEPGTALPVPTKPYLVANGIGLNVVANISANKATNIGILCQPPTFTMSATKHPHANPSDATATTTQSTHGYWWGVDPTRCFSFLVLSIIHVRYWLAHEWDGMALLQGFWCNFYVLSALAIGCITVALSCYDNSRNKTNPNPHNRNAGSLLPVLPWYDRWAVEWYWWNGWFYHLVLDGATGTFRLVPVAVHQYDQLDRRFVARHPIPWGVGLVEVVLMAPLCFACVYCILTNRSHLRYPLELIVGTLQYMGLVLFMASEVILDQQVNVPALDPVGIPGNRWANVKLWDFYHFTYYWFGFWFCNLVWAVIPLIRMKRAWMEITQALRVVAVETSPPTTNVTTGTGTKRLKAQ